MKAPSPLLDEVKMAVLPDGNAVCFGGRFHGWLFRRHPDGQWVSVQKLSLEEPVYDDVFNV